MREGHAHILAAGARLVVVLCQDEEAVRGHFARDPVPFPVAVDAARSAARAFGVHRVLGFDALNIARPATFVLDHAGMVCARFVARFQWQSLPLEDLLRAVSALGPKAASP